MCFLSIVLTSALRHKNSHVAALMNRHFVLYIMRASLQHTELYFKSNRSKAKRTGCQTVQCTYYIRVLFFQLALKFDEL